MNGTYLGRRTGGGLFGGLGCGEGWVGILRHWRSAMVAECPPTPLWELPATNKTVPSADLSAIRFRI
jgi:hypothetical protein